MSLPLPLDPGTVIGGHYIIDSLINSGGFGSVYRGTDTSESNRPCAIKETYDVTPSARRQALLEASILFLVNSKNLPQVYDAFDANGRFYLVMQLIEGQNLLQLLRSRGCPCSEQEVITWLLPVMRVLQELHSHNPPIIHRDIKPGNIIVTPNQTAVLVDFGLTKLYDPTRHTQTIIKAVSEGFSPVEQYMGHTSPQSDIYSLAATMYFLLTNCLSPPALKRSMRDELITPRILNPALSLKIERILLKALAVNADERYQSMQEFIKALEEPAFNAYADPTVVASRVPSSMSSVPRQAPSSDPYVNLQGLQSLPAYRLSPPAYQPPRPVPPPGYVMVPQSALVAQPLPSAFGQGCLWGLLQGLLAALLVLFLKKEVYFYVAIVIGFLFYMLAGYRTTYKGGKSTRGGWAGFWAGIISTVMFWTSFMIGLLVLLTQRIQADSVTAQQNGEVLHSDEANQAWHAVISMFPNHQVAQQQASGTSTIILIVVGMLIAFGFGWLGGLLGQSSYQTRAVKSCGLSPADRRRVP
jgi:serine/threonine protein kinase